MATQKSQDWEAWQRAIYESLRSIDTDARYWVGLAELDFRGAVEQRLDDFPFDDLRESVDGWLAKLSPDTAQGQEYEWRGGGVRMRFYARARSANEDGWSAMPSFNQLEQRMSDLHIVGDGTREFISLTLDEIDRLAKGELRLVGQGDSYQGTFKMLADEMRHFGLTQIAEMHPTVITAHAGLLGLVEPPPGLGNFDQGWREINRRWPND